MGLGETVPLWRKRGPFFHIPPRLMHRNLNPNLKHAFVVVSILVGRGAPVVSVEEPPKPTGHKEPRESYSVRKSV